MLQKTGGGDDLDAFIGERAGNGAENKSSRRMSILFHRARAFQSGMMSRKIRVLVMVPAKAEIGRAHV